MSADWHRNLNDFIGSGSDSVFFFKKKECILVSIPDLKVIKKCPINIVHSYIQVQKSVNAIFM